MVKVRDDYLNGESKRRLSRWWKEKKTSYKVKVRKDQLDQLDGECKKRSARL